jgi:hypothetical protein
MAIYIWAASLSRKMVPSRPSPTSCRTAAGSSNEKHYERYERDIILVSKYLPPRHHIPSYEMNLLLTTKPVGKTRPKPTGEKMRQRATKAGDKKSTLQPKLLLRQECTAKNKPVKEDKLMLLTKSGLLLKTEIPRTASWIINWCHLRITSLRVQLSVHHQHHRINP